MQIFITGASGFIGGAIARHLAPEHRVRAMARSERAAARVRATGAEPVHCDLAGIQAAHLAGCDTVIHCAALVAPWGARADFVQTNVTGTENMLRAARAAGVRRFIHLGTEAALFRGQELVDIDESHPYPERTPFLYSETKRDAEKRVLAAHESGIFHAVSLRPRLVWGPGDTTILPNLVALVDRGVFRWIDRGKPLTSTTHIANLVAGVEAALTRGKGGTAYFITDDGTRTLREFLGQMLVATGHSPGSRSVPGWLVRSVAWWAEALWKVLGRRTPPPVTRFSAAIVSVQGTLRNHKAKRELGYQPVISVAEGMAQLAAAGD
ncbi:MAG: NAD-dependent epimerase/dehydratase family protein [Bacteroidota bacterium]